MPKITYIEHDGNRHEVDAKAGDTVMSAAVDNGVPGIDADCGGGCSCGTCHVFVDPAWFARTGKPSNMEQGMLKGVPSRTDNSRLSCQIDVKEELDGLVVTLPQFQM